ncbi:MAG: DUF1461 domain-containing protein [Nanoarchaeota archaeon]|nr:DUF1461 domain-containing protein [Nanoarchaeota archaeon]
MKFLTLSKVLMILILPFLLFLLVLNFVGFDNRFYQEKFSEYEIQQNVPEAVPLHEKVINFITGKNDKPPQEFNEREKQHLFDVRKAVRISTILLYILIILFVLLLIVSSFILKVNNYITSFVGKVLVFGGFLTVIMAVSLFLLINSDFSKTFESFHRLLFEKGTYTFDPAKEMIVKLYPEKLFMDLGLKISKWIILASAIVVLSGAFLILKSKSKKNKK